MAIAYARQKKLVLFPSGACYAFSSAFATYIIWAPISLPAGIAILIFTLVLPALGLFFFLIDYLWTPFCLELRYLVIVWWALAPLSIPLNLSGMVLRVWIQTG